MRITKFSKNSSAGSKNLRARRLATGLTVLALSAGVVAPLATIAPAHAIGNSDVYVYNLPIAGPVYSTGALYAIVSNTTEGELLWCIQSGTVQPGPDEVLNRQNIPSNPENVKAPADLVVNPTQMAYILGKIGRTPDQLTEGAVSYVVHANFEQATDFNPNPQSVVDFMVNQIKQKHPEVHAKAVELVREARANSIASFETAGVDSDENLRTGVINNVGVKNEAGQWQAGIPFAVKIMGPAVFDKDKSTIIRGVTTTSPLSFTWTATGSGEVTFDSQYTHGRKINIVKHDANGNIQDTLSLKPGAVDPEESRPSKPFRVRANFQPEATSNVGDAKVAEDMMIKDTLTVFANTESGEWMKLGGKPVPVTFEGTAYWTGENLPVEANTAPEGAEVIGTTTITANGPGEYTSEAIKAPKSGFVTWVWKLVKNNQTEVVADITVSDLIKGDWNDKFGLPDETSSVPFEVEVDSSVVNRVSKAGTHLGDDLWVKGFPENHGEFQGGSGFNADVPEMTNKLFFFPEELEVTDENKDKAELIGEVKIPARNGYYGATGLDKLITKKAEEPGTYVFVTEFPGSDRVKAFASSVTDKTEQFIVKQPKVELKTTATNNTTGGKTIPNHGPVEINDKVCYNGVVPGKEYTLNGKLVDEKGETLLDNGREVTASKKFIPNEAEGCENLVFKLDASVIKGEKTVAFEEMSLNKKVVGVHADLNDEGQTVKRVEPTLKTTATNKDNGGKTIPNHGIVTISDKVCYTELIPGKKYTLQGMLMDVAKETPIVDNGKNVTATLDFVPKSANECVNLDFKTDAKNLPSEKTVVFEKLVYENNVVAKEENFKNEGQTVKKVKPKLQTTATDKKDGDKVISSQPNVQIADKVCYTDLVPGKTYTLNGTLMNKATGKPLGVDGDKASKKFTPKESKGCEEIVFTVDGSKLKGVTTVVFENATHENIEVASHADINDEGQTVKFDGGSLPKTGLATGVGIVSALSMLVGVGGIVSRRRMSL